ncbi:hypothetical protein ACFQ0M_28445 [Kitasatospora aburaviensis]
MPNPTIRGALAGLALLPALALAAPAASAASPSPTASGTPAPATKAGTSFLTAINLSPARTPRSPPPPATTCTGPSAPPRARPRRSA